MTWLLNYFFNRYYRWRLRRHFQREKGWTREEADEAIDYQLALMELRDRIERMRL